MFAIQPYGNAGGGDGSNFVLPDFPGLVQVGDQLDLDAALMRCNQCLRNSRMGKRKRLHQHLLTCRIDGVDDIARRVVTRREEHLDIGGDVRRRFRRLEGMRRRYHERAHDTCEQCQLSEDFTREMGRNHEARILPCQPQPAL